MRKKKKRNPIFRINSVALESLPTTFSVLTTLQFRTIQ